MTARDPDLDRLTRMLGQCLGRIDEQAYRIQQLGDTVGYDAADQLEDETAQLQELVSSLIALQAGVDETDVNQVLEQVARRCIEELEIPIVVRQSLQPNLPRVPFPPPLISVALQRATMLAADCLTPGGDLVLTTRLSDGVVLVEVEAHSCEREEGLVDRTETLRELVVSFGGNCHTDQDQQHSVFVVLELPLQAATDHSESI